MQFIYDHPYLTGFIVIILVNMVVKETTKSKSSPVGWTLISIVSLIGQACSPFSGAVNEKLSNNYYYGKSGKQIRYSPGGNWFELGNNEMEADAQTFTPLGSEFGMDKDHVFYKSHIIDNEVDISSFRVVGRLGFDKDHVYFPADGMAYSIQDTLPPNLRMFVLEGADPETFSETEDLEWSKDAQHWFYGYKMIDVHYESFTPINDYFCKDDYKVYRRLSFEIIPCEIDAQTFKQLNNRYVADDKYIYDYGEWNDGEEEKLVKKFGYQSLENVDFLSDDYLLFDNSVIYEGRLIEDANRKYFKVLPSATKAYAKDDQMVFYDGREIQGGDLESFRLYDNDQYSRDKNWVYYFGKKMEGVDVETFGPIDDEKWIYRDKDHIYVGDEIRDNYPN